MSDKNQRLRLRVGNGLPSSLLIIIEIFAIIIGVMLGFLVNEWRENRNNQKIVENALGSIAAEFQYNHQRMVETFEYYHGFVLAIDSLNQAGEPVREMYGYEVDNWRGAMPPMLRSSSYQMTLTTGIFKDMDFETANTLAFIYNLQSILEKLDDSSINRFSTDSGFTALPTIRHLFGLYVEIIPSVIGTYQKYGIPLLEEYGYKLELDEGPLKTEAERQIEYLDLSDY